MLNGVKFTPFHFLVSRETFYICNRKRNQKSVWIVKHLKY